MASKFDYTDSDDTSSDTTSVYSSGSEYEDDDVSSISSSDTEYEYATDEELDELIHEHKTPIKVEPKLEDILQKMADLKGKYYRSIIDEFNSVCKWFKNEHDSITNFFLPNNTTYDLKDFKHIYLIRLLVDYASCKHPRVREYLDTISDVLPIGVVRVKRGNSQYYRIRVGIHN